MWSSAQADLTLLSTINRDQLLRPDLLLVREPDKIDLATLLSILHGESLPRHDLIEGLTNAANCVRYTNASWTLGADAAMTIGFRVVNYVDTEMKNVMITAVGGQLKRMTFLNLKRGTGSDRPRSICPFPVIGDHGSHESITKGL